MKTAKIVNRLWCSNNQKKLLKSQAGFSLIELVIVMAIIGILSAVLLPNFGMISQKAKESSSKSNAHTLQVALEAYFLAAERYPEGSLDIEELTAALKSQRAITKDLNNPFTGKSASKSDKSGKITYSYNSTTGGYSLQIYGQDNQKEIAVLEN